MPAARCLHDGERVWTRVQEPVGALLPEASRRCARDGLLLLLRSLERRGLWCAAEPATAVHHWVQRWQGPRASVAYSLGRTRTPEAPPQRGCAASACNCRRGIAWFAHEARAGGDGQREVWPSALGYTAGRELPLLHGARGTSQSVVRVALSILDLLAQARSETSGPNPPGPARSIRRTVPLEEPTPPSARTEAASWLPGRLRVCREQERHPGSDRECCSSAACSGGGISDSR